MHLREAKQCFTPCLTRSPSSWSHEVDVLYFQYQCYRLGQNSKLVKLFQIPFFKKNILIQTSCSKSRKKSYQWHSIHSHTSYPDSKHSKKRKICIVCFIGVCFLLSVTTEINIFWHWFCALCTLWSGFFCAPTIFAAKGNKATKFWQNLPCFLSKKTQKTTENYGQPKPPIISSQKIDVFKGYSIG